MSRRRKESFIHRHSLSITVGLVVLGLIVVYSMADPKTHIGTFFGNAIADWSGLLVIVLATKGLYEKGSAESRQPPAVLRPFPKVIQEHSLTIFLVLTGLGWMALYSRVNPEAKWGEVVGNIVSEWTQIMGTVWLTKKLIEVHSKESRR